MGPQIEALVALLKEIFKDSFKYYHAVHVSRELDWIKHKSEKGWVRLEQDMLPLPLQTLL